jgi:D-galactarolactone cycloisomerase
MKITAVETTVVSLPCETGGPPPLFAGKPWTHLDILVVRVETDGGLVGWGEAFGHAAIPSTKAALDTIVAPLVLGRDPRNVQSLTRELLHAVHLLGRNGPFVYAFSGVEIALWDILGKSAGLPVHRLLGGGRPSELPAYASLLHYGSSELVARNTAAACAEGYRYIKLHETTREAVLAASGAPGAGDARIMLDVNCAWSVPVACDMADSLAKDRLMWLEEPVWPPEDCEGLAQVRARGIPISAGENVAGLYGFKSLIKAGAIDIAQPSVTKIGGIGETVRVIDLCNAHGVEPYPHSPYFGPGLVATLHVAAARIERPLVEVLWLKTEENPFDPWVKAVDGRMKVPQSPGLGCDPDLALLARYATGAPTTTRLK